MRSSLGIALLTAAVLATSATMDPAQAACPGTGGMIDSGWARLISNPDWCNGYYGCYATPPVSSGLDGFFWGQTGANGARNAGVDSGSFLLDSWTVRRPTVAGYYYNVYLADPAYGYLNGFISWNHSGIDGCIRNITPRTSFDECTCLMMTDSWNGRGYFTLLSAKSNGNGDFTFFGQPYSWVTFGLIPRPIVVGSTRDPATGDLAFAIDVPQPTSGDYRNPLCDCGFGFRVYQYVVGAGAAPPIDRRACTQETLFRSTGQSIAPNDPGFIDACRAAGFGWVPALDASGAPQSFTRFGPNDLIALKVACGDPENVKDVYLATSLGTDEGPGQIQFTHVSQNSFRITCAPEQLAQPNRPRRPEPPARFSSRDFRGGRERQPRRRRNAGFGAGART